MSFNTQLVRSHGRSIHKRSTLEILLKGKMLGEAARMFSSPHRFEKQSYTTPAYCDYCSHVLWGLVKTGGIAFTPCLKKKNQQKNKQSKTKHPINFYLMSPIHLLLHVELWLLLCCPLCFFVFVDMCCVLGPADILLLVMSVVMKLFVVYIILMTTEIAQHKLPRKMNHS